jgi:predicted nucleic acid-binding protein
VLYVDTSALAKLYISEAGSDWVRVAVENERGRVFTSLVTYVEVLSALERAKREKRIDLRQHARQVHSFLTDWNAIHILELSQELLAPARRLIQQYSLRAYDAIHLCSALWTGKPAFACFDARLSSAATAEGLPVLTADA